MNKILSILLILFTTLIANAQYNAPAEGTLGSKTKREYVRIERTSNFDILLDDSGQGETHVRTEILGGTIEKISYKGRDVVLQNCIESAADHIEYFSRLEGNSGIVRVTVKWTTKGSGEFRFRQENDIDCFDQDYSVYYTKVIEWDYFTFGISGLFGVCAGEEGTLNVYFGGKEEWADEETRSYSLSGYKEKISRTLTKKDVGNALKRVTSTRLKDLYGEFCYLLEIKLTSPIDFKKGSVYVVKHLATSVIMKNGENVNNEIKIVFNRKEVTWMITPVPKENAIKHN